MSMFDLTRILWADLGETKLRENSSPFISSAFQNAPTIILSTIIHTLTTNSCFVDVSISNIAFTIAIIFELKSICTAMDNGLMSTRYNNNVGVDKNNDGGIGTNIRTLNNPNVSK